MNTGSEQSLAQKRFQLDLMWYSMMGGLVVYGLILVFFDKTILAWPGPFTEYDSLFCLGSLIVFIVSLFISFKVLNKRFDTAEDSVAHYYKFKVMQWGIVEAICIFGFIASYISENIYPYCMGLVISEVLLIIYRPKIDFYLKSTLGPKSY